MPLKYADVIITSSHYSHNCTLPPTSLNSYLFFYIKACLCFKKLNIETCFVLRFALFRSLFTTFERSGMEIFLSQRGPGRKRCQGKCVKCLLCVSSDKLFVLQLVVSGLRGVTRVILANNPLSGALILAALYWASPWQGLLGTLGVLASTLTAVIMGQDRWNTDTNKLKKVHIYDDMYDNLGVTRQANVLVKISGAWEATLQHKPMICSTL